MKPSDRTLQDLGFPLIQRALAQRCRTRAGEAQALVRPLLDSRPEIETALQQVEEGRRLRKAGLRLSLDRVVDVRDASARAAKGGLLEPRELIDVAQTLLAFARSREALETREEEVPGLAVWGRQLPSLESLAMQLDRAFESGGEISDRASTELKSAREHARGLHRNIKSRMETLLRDDTFAVNLRDSYYSLRNDRYVLPVLAQHRQEVPGIVHNASQSGQTLFVEPQALVGLGNDLAIAQSLVLEEERRVLEQLSSAVGREASRIEAGVVASAHLDEAEAAALLAEDLDAHSPLLEPANGDLSLHELRHPFLVLQSRSVVANDVELLGGIRALVISGPNAGGKTVTLTAVGLSALMVQAGLPIPAEAHSRLPLFTSIHSAVGDAQSLDEGLSSFSSHLAELREIQQHVKAGALVLIDEIAADTDPQEGAALAGAVLEDLLERNAAVLVTTHLEELKALAHVDPRFANARVGLDARKMTPTYRLQMGAAGTSSAIALAERMGLSAKTCERARERMQGSGGVLARALHGLEEDRQRLARETAEAESERAQLRRERTQLEAERQTLRDTYEGEAKVRRDQLQAELHRALAETRARVAALKQAQSLEEAEAAQSVLRSQLQTLEHEVREEEIATALPPPPELRKGMWVRHLGLGRDVQILEVDGEQLRVAAGALTLRAVRSDIAGAAGGSKRTEAPKPPRDAPTRLKAVAAGAVESDEGRCDVRGERVDDAVRQVEGFLDRLTREGKRTALVVHGHGTGALKSALRGYLGASPYVEQFRAGDRHEGGDGATVITLRS